mgnify:CR=1 FL=1
MKPLLELRRLLVLQTAYESMNRGDHALERDDIDAAVEYYGRAEALFPANLEMKFWHAASLVNAVMAAATICWELGQLLRRLR